MINKKSITSAFTLIELLVVITIIGILAGIALPVFNSVQLKGAQTKALAQAKQIGLALKLFASDNNGTYPIYLNAVGTGGGTAAAGGIANQDFSCLFPTYTQSESIFANKYCFYNTKVPDNVIDAAGAMDTKTLAAGENAYAYIEGLTDTFNPSCPIVFDGPAGAVPTYVNTPNTKGYVWGTNKAVVIRLDNSGSLDTLVSTTAGTVTTYTDMGSDPTTGTMVNILDPAANKAMNGCFCVLPK